MSNIQIILSRDIYQDNVVEPVTLTNPLYVGDNLAQRVRFRVFRRHGDIAPVDMSSLAIRAYFARPDGGTVMMDGVSGKEWSYVDLPAACYAYPGTFDLVIKSVADAAETTIMRVKGELDKPVTGTLVDPGTDVGNIEEIVEAFLEIDSARNTCVEAAGTSTAAAETATAAADAASADAQTASGAAASAQESAQAAGDSAANASESETSASGSAAAAAASETNAAGSATEAAGSAADAAASKAAALAAQNAAQAAQAAAETAASEEVADWLAAHVYPETGYVLDNTLAIQGAAADAKAAGDAIGDLKSAISNCIALAPVEITPTIVKGQRFNPETGASGSNSNFCRTNSLIDIPSNGIRAVELADNAYTYNISYYDSTGATDGTGHINTSNGSSGLTYLPQDAVKIGLSFYKGGTAMTDSDKTAIGAALNFYNLTDTTLTLEGVPADAHAVGARLDDLESEIEEAASNTPTDLYIEIEPEYSITKGQRFNPDGGASQSNSNFCRTTSLLNNEFCAIDLTNSNYTYYVSYYDSTGATSGTGYIDKSTSTSGRSSIPDTAAKIGLSFYKGGETMQDSDVTTIKAALKFYRRTDTTLTKKDVPADAYTVGNKLDALDANSVVNEVFTSWTDPADGKYASFEASNLKVTLNRTATNRQYAVMDCKAGEKIVLKGVASNTGYMRGYIFTDDSGNVGADTEAWRANASSVGTKVQDFELMVPAGATRVYINRTYSSEGNPDSYKVLSSTEYTDKRAGNKGLKIVCLGDSIFGNFRTSFGASKGIPNMISDRTGATVYNHAFGGTHATTQSWTSPMDFQNLVAAIVDEDFTDQIEFATEKGAGYVARVNDVAATDFDDVDIVTVSYGTNDWSGNATPAAYKTALEAGITALATAYPHLRFLLCTPIIRFQHVGSAPIDAETEEDEGTGEIISSDDDRMVNGGGNKLTAYVDAVEEVGRKMHIPVCENYWSLGINLLNYEVYLHGQSDTDLTHPCRAGRELIAGHLVDAIKRMQV